MNKAFVTIVVSGTTCSTLLEELQHADVGTIQVLAQGDICISDKDLSTLPTSIWLHEPVFSKGRQLRHVANGDSTAGRWVTDEELSVLKQYGVCVEFQAAYSSKAPGYNTIHVEAAQAEVSNYGFDVADNLKSDCTWVDEATIEEGTEKRWLRIAMPSWFNLNL